MALFDKILKRRKKEAPVPSVSATQKENNSEVKPAQNDPPQQKTVGTRTSILNVLRSPHITEKTSDAAALNKYVFRVDRTTNKDRVRRAVEARYGVGVAEVNILNVHGKERRRGRQIGWKQGYKKAVVTVKKGESIEIQ
jgi:large subunit ribosomal protein L23